MKKLLILAAALALVACGAAAQATFPEVPPTSDDVVAPRFAVPSVDRTLPNGVRLVLLEEHSLPTFDFAFYVAGGDAADPAGRRGLGTLVAKLATEGTARRTSVQLASAVEGLGASLSASSDAEWFGFHGRSLASASGELLGLFAEVLSGASFPADELAKAVDREKQALKARRAQPMYLGLRALYETVFAGCPQGTFDLDEAFLDTVTRDEVVAHYARAVQNVPPGGALFVALGDFDAAALAARVETLLGRLPHEGGLGLTVRCTPSTTPQVLLVDRPGSAQSAIVVGRPVGGFSDARRVELDLADEVLGGGPSRRLFVRLREELGLTYGAYSNVQRYQASGLWSAALSARTEKTGEALSELLAVARGLAEKGIGADELAVAESYSVGSFVLHNAAPGQVLSLLAEALRNGEAPDFWTRYIQRLGAVTPAEVVQVARELAPFDEATTVVIVGDAKAVRPQLDFLPADRIREVTP